MIRPKNCSPVLLISTIILACVVIVGWSNRGQAFSRVAWEYKVVITGVSGGPSLANTDAERYFGELGAEGWELVQWVPDETTTRFAWGTRTGAWIFKRAK